MPTENDMYGLVAEFRHAGGDSVRRDVHASGGVHAGEAYTPFPVEGLAASLGSHKTWVARIVLIGAIVGGCGAFFMMWYANVISYTWNIGGKPPNSWPAFIPITFELAVLGAAVTAVVGMLAMNGLPQPYHPLFNHPQFGMASRDRFFLCIERCDPKFDRVKTKTFLESLGPVDVAEVAK